MSSSISLYSIGTPDALATSMTSRISLRVIGIELGDDFSHEWVSSMVSVVRAFQAQFHVTFDHR